MKSNMISVIIPVFNQAEKLKKCLETLLKQTYQDFEIILVDDGSSDNIDAVVDAYKNKFERFKFIKKNNEGSNPTRNRGFKESIGDYLLFCDADLMLKNDMLEKMLKTLENNPGKAFVYCSFKLGLKKFKLFPYSQERLRKTPFIHTSSLMKRAYFSGFDEKIKRLQDWDLWLTMMEKGCYGIWINEVLFKVHSGGYISSWLPSFFYKLFPKNKKVEKYNQAVKIIKEKHNL